MHEVEVCYILHTQSTLYIASIVRYMYFGDGKGVCFVLSTASRGFHQSEKADRREGLSFHWPALLLGAFLLGLSSVVRATHSIAFSLACGRQKRGPFNSNGALAAASASGADKETRDMCQLKAA